MTKTQTPHTPDYSFLILPMCLYIFTFGGLSSLLPCFLYVHPSWPPSTWLDPPSMPLGKPLGSQCTADLTPVLYAGGCNPLFVFRVATTYQRVGLKQPRFILSWSWKPGVWNKLSQGSREGSFWGFPRILSVLSLWQHPPNSYMCLSVYRFASS